MQARVYDVSASEGRSCSVCQLCVVRPHRGRILPELLGLCKRDQKIINSDGYLQFFLIFWYIKCTSIGKHHPAARQDISIEAIQIQELPRGYLHREYPDG